MNLHYLSVILYSLVMPLQITKMISNQMSLLFFEQELDSNILFSDSPGAEQFIKHWSEAEDFALDIETYGEEQNDPLDPWKGHIRLIQIGLRDGRSFIADLGGWDDDKEALFSRLNKLRFFETLKDTLFSSKIKTIGHNLKFDLMWLYKKYGFRALNCFDTMLLSQVYWAGIKEYRHSLKAVCGRLGIEVDKTEQKSNWGFGLSNNQLNYAASDTQAAIAIYDKLISMCKEDGLTASVSAEMGALPAFAEMEINGFPVDRGLLVETKTKYFDTKEQIIKPFKEAFPNLGLDDHKKIPDDLKSIGICVGKSDKEALNPYRGNPIISSLLAGRSINAYCNYIEGMINAFRDCSVRGGYRQCAPEGRGRSTSGGGNGVPSINLQNPPNPSKMCSELEAFDLPPIRGCFKAPQGYKMAVVDLSGAHARIAAQATGDKAFRESYTLNKDPHTIVASRLSELEGLVWSPEYISKIRKEDTPEGKKATKFRNTAKNVFYGWLNGAGKNKTSETIRIGGWENSVDFAGTIIDTLRAAFPDIAAFHDRLKNSIKKGKHFEGCKTLYTPVTCLTGRRVWLPIWKPSEKNKYGGAKPTDAYMASWMMVEADAMKAAMHFVRLEGIKHPEWDLQIVNICHDELDVIFKEEYAEQAAHKVWQWVNGCLGFFVTDIPVTDSEFKLSSVLCDSWAEK